MLSLSAEGKYPLLCKGLGFDEKQEKIYKNPNNDPKGRWRGVPMTAQGYRPNQMYGIETPSGKVVYPPKGRCWSTVESEYKKLLAAGRIYFGKNGDGQPQTIRYLSEVEGAFRGHGGQVMRLDIQMRQKRKS